MIDPLGIQDQDGDIRELKKSVEHFGEPGFVLIPHQKPFWRKVYTHIWIVPVVFLVILTTFLAFQIRQTNLEVNYYLPKKVWKMLDLILIKKCEEIESDEENGCSLSFTRNINEQPELKIALTRFLEISPENTALDFKSGRGSYFLNTYNLTSIQRRILFNFSSYTEAISYIEKIRDYDWQFANDLSENREAFEFFYQLNNQEYTLFRDLLSLNLDPLTSRYEFYSTDGKPVIRIEPQYWYLDHQDQFHTQYALIFNYDYPTSVVFTLFFAHLIAIIPVCLIFIYLISLMNRFSIKTPQAFHQLVMKGILIPRENETADLPKLSPTRNKWKHRPTHWSTYARDLEMAITASPWRVVLYCFITLTFLAITIPIAEEGNVFQVGHDIWYKGYMYTILLVAPPVISYLLSQYIWVLSVTSQYLINLPRYFTIRIDPDMEDGSGGLKPIGDLIIITATLLLPFIILVMIWSFPGYFSIFGLKGLDILLIMMSTTLFLLTFLMFLRPLTAIHKEMKTQKKLFQLEAERSKSGLIKKLRALAMEGQLSSPEGKIIRSQLETLDKIYSPGVRFPTWPISTGSRPIYLAAQIIQVISIGAGIVEVWQFLISGPQ